MLSLPLLFVFFLLIIYFYRGNERKGDKVIPGPYSYPIIGNIHQFIGMLPSERFRIWAEKYGSLYQFKIGWKANIVISETSLLKEIFSEPAFTGRPFVNLLQYNEKERLGFAINDGPFWQFHRRFTLKKLKDLGAFPRKLESTILSQFKRVASTFSENQGEPLTSHKVKQTMARATTGAIWGILCSGHDGSEAVPLLDRLMTSLNPIVKCGMLAIFMPILNKICPKLTGYKEYREAMDEYGAFFIKALEERKKTFDPENIRDYIDVFLLEAKNAEPGSPFYGEKPQKHLLQSLVELYGGAGDTSGGIFEWAVLYLCKNQKVQLKLQEEIKQVTGNTRHVLLDDKPLMPYANSIIEEAFRSAPIVPFGFQHRALEDKEICGYFIPKDTWLLPNIYYIHHNKMLWGDPETFRPERFIEDGKFKKNDNVIPFGTGKRQCIGEFLGRDTLFLYLTNVFQQFTMAFDPNKKEPGIEPKISFVLEPHPFHVVMKRRLNLD